MKIYPEKVLTWVFWGASILFMGSMLMLFDLPENTAGELTKQPTFTEEENSKVTLLFVGDIMLSRSVGTKMVAIGDYKYPFLDVADILRSADLTFGNLESPISDRGVNQGSIYSFRADPKVVEGLSYAGIDVLSIANNHIWDWGTLALLDTISILKDMGITSVGAGANYEQANKPAFFEIKDTKIAMLAYTNLLPKSMQANQENPGLSDFDLDKIGKVIKTFNDKDLVVASLHWGEEYETLSNDSQKEIARWLIDAGANLVVGHHPHVIQELEQYGDGWIAYSLGNFIFDQSFSPETMRGAALRVELEEGNIVGVTILPVEISSNFQPSFVEPNTTL